MSAPLTEGRELDPLKWIRPEGVVIVENYADLPRESISHNSEGITKQAILSYHDTQGNLTQVAIAWYSEGAWFDPHIHDDMDELFIVLEGTVVFSIGDDGEEIYIQAGGSIYFPRGVRHGARTHAPAVVQTIGVRARTDLGKGQNIPA